MYTHIYIHTYERVGWAYPIFSSLGGMRTSLSTTKRWEKKIFASVRVLLKLEQPNAWKKHLEGRNLVVVVVVVVVVVGHRCRGPCPHRGRCCGRYCGSGPIQSTFPVWCSMCTKYLAELQRGWVLDAFFFRCFFSLANKIRGTILG